MLELSRKLKRCGGKLIVDEHVQAAARQHDRPVGGVKHQPRLAIGVGVEIGGQADGDKFLPCACSIALNLSQI